MLTTKDIKKIEKYLDDTKRMEVKEFFKKGQKIREIQLELSNGTVLVGDLNQEHLELKPLKGLTTISSNFVRGHYGKSSYRGNCSGRLIKDVLEFFKPKLFADPMMGSGTSVDVCKELGINYWASDLREGFDMIKMDMPIRPDFIWMHPPYYVPEGSFMPKYSGVQWGTKPHESDGSHLTNYEDFLSWFNKLQARAYESLENGGRVAILMGDTRYKGKLYSPVKDMDVYGELEHLIIKQQHNCVSDSINYSGKFIPIVHEYLVIIKKNQIFVIPCRISKSIELNFENSIKITWKNLIAKYVENAGGEISRKSLYEQLKKHPKAKDNHHVEEKVRQIVNTFDKIFKVDGDKVSLVAA